MLVSREFSGFVVGIYDNGEGVEFDKMGHSSQVRGKAACADRHCSQSKWPSARIADLDIDTRCLIYSDVFDRSLPYMTTHGVKHPNLMPRGVPSAILLGVARIGPAQAHTTKGPWS